jgi:hypothetical protein
MDYRKAEFPPFNLQPAKQGADVEPYIRKLLLTDGFLPSLGGAGETVRPVPYMTLRLFSEAHPVDGIVASFQNSGRTHVPYGELLADPRWGKWEKQALADPREEAIEEAYCGERHMQLHPTETFRSWLEYALVSFNVKLMRAHEYDMEPLALLKAYQRYRIHRVTAVKEYRSGAVRWEQPLFSLELEKQLWETVAEQTLPFEQQQIDKRRAKTEETPL